MTGPTSPVPAWRLWLRLAIFVGLAAWMNANPFIRQALQIRRWWLRNWVMFDGTGRKICTVRYVSWADGGERELDRYALLGHAAWWEAPKSVRRARTSQEADAIGKKLCAHLDPPPEVRVYAACSVRDKGWVVERSGETNLCAR